MEDFINSPWFELLNTLAIIFLGLYTFRANRQVEHLKSKLDLKTSSEKRYVELQQSSVLNLVEGFNNLIELIRKIPRKHENFSLEYLIDTYYEPAQQQSQPEKMKLGNIVLLVEDKNLTNSIFKYHERLLFLTKEKRDMIEALSNTIDKNELKKISVKYLYLCNNVYKKEYQEFIKETRLFLKKSFQNIR